MIPFTITNDTITVVVDGKSKVVRKGAPNFAGLRQALLDEQWGNVPKHLSPGLSVTLWAKGRFSIKSDAVWFDDLPVPESMNKRIFAMATAGESPEPLFKFYERLAKNPSKRAVDSLWDFLAHAGHPICEDGCFLAYKYVRPDFKDQYSGKFDNRPGVVNEMPRNRISDDPNHACAEGFHVGSLSYAQANGGPVVVTKVDPADVVSVPYDERAQKCRVCRYEIIGHYGQKLPSTVMPIDYDKVEVDGEVPCSTDENLCDDPLCPIHGDDAEAVEAPIAFVTPEPEEAEPVTEHGEGVRTRGPRARKRHAFDKLDAIGLMKKPLAALRKYAAETLKIIGATKIPGGRVALIDAITAVRGMPE